MPLPLPRPHLYLDIALAYAAKAIFALVQTQQAYRLITGLPVPWAPQSQPIPFIFQWMSLPVSAVAHSLCPLSENSQSLLNTQRIILPFLSHFLLLPFAQSHATGEFVSVSVVYSVPGKMFYTQ